MMLLNSKLFKLKTVLTLGLAFWANSSWGNCSKINFQDFHIEVNMGGSLYIDPATPVGTIIAQQVVTPDSLYSYYNGWVGVCNNSDSSITNWWLEQHYSASNHNGPVPNIPAPTTDGHMYVLNDNGRNNPYGGSGSGSVGYTVEVLSGGQALPFGEYGGQQNPTVNVPPLTTGPIYGIPCQEAKSHPTWGAFAGNCNSQQTVLNWRQLGPFQIKVTFYRLGGTVPASGLIINGNETADRSISLMSLIDNSQPANNLNKNMFNLTRISFSGPIQVNTSPCGSFTNPVVDLNQVNKSAFTTVGQPAVNIVDTPVNITAQCSSNTSVKWAIMGTRDSYDVDGSQGILALNSENGKANGIGIQLIDTSGNPLPITPVNSFNYQWIDTNLSTDSRGYLMIAFLARYVRVGNVTSGPANSQAFIVVSPK